jgi:hypothetical protein
MIVEFDGQPNAKDSQVDRYSVYSGKPGSGFINQGEFLSEQQFMQHQCKYQRDNRNTPLSA